MHVKKMETQMERCKEDEARGWGREEAVQIGPTGEISCSLTLEAPDGRLGRSNCGYDVHVNYRGRRRVNKAAVQDGSEDAQVLPQSKQVNEVTF